MDKRKLEEALFKVLMVLSTLIVMGSLTVVMVIVLMRGLPALNLAMLTQLPRDLDRQGGVLNAIVGSLLIGLGATAAAMILSVPIVFYLQKDYAGRSRLASVVRLALDILWGIPSIVYGAFGLIIMLYLGMHGSLLGGIIAISLVELPIMVRAMDEVMRLVPKGLKDASYALGATRLETTTRVIWRQVLPGIVTGILLAFGRGIGDAAGVLLTTGYTDKLPTSLMDPVGSLPLAIFNLLLSPFPEVQQRAYASGAILLAMVLLVSIIARVLARRFERHVVR